MNTVNTNKTAKIECYITEDLIDLYGYDYFVDYPIGWIKENTNKYYNIDDMYSIYCEYVYDSNTHSHCYFLKAYPEDDSGLYSFYFTNV